MISDWSIHVWIGLGFITWLFFVRLVGIKFFDSIYLDNFLYRVCLFRYAFARLDRLIRSEVRLNRFNYTYLNDFSYWSVYVLIGSPITWLFLIFRSISRSSGLIKFDSIEHI